VSDLAGGAI